jgi:uncharacterized membrane protein YkvA (DUF1232 family)
VSSSRCAASGSGAPSNQTLATRHAFVRTAARSLKLVQWWTWLLVSLGVLLIAYTLFLGWLVARGRSESARAFATFIPDCVVLVSRLAREPRVPRRRKLLLFGLVAYLALPFDLVPDFIPIAGQLDDVVIVALVLRRFIQAGGEPLIRELWPGPEQSLSLVLRLASPRTSTPRPSAGGLP